MIDDLIDRFLELVPENIHPMPIAMAWDGEAWEVDLQARTLDGMDIDGYARDEDMFIAYERAFQRVAKSKMMYERLGYVPN